MDHNDWQQQLEERRRQEEEECACTPTTSLFDLCAKCTDKAWHYAYTARKREDVGGSDYLYDGRDYYVRTNSGQYRNITNDKGQDEIK